MDLRHLISDTDGWKRLSALFDELFDLPVEQRADWLDRLQDTDATAAAQLRQLLAAHEHVERAGYLESPTDAPAQPGAVAGHRFGAYRLVEPLGQGGMGVVWLAERADGRFEGKVAIKLLNAGRLRPADVERFRREASALARLSHPHIARLVDAGVADDGQPYLVLEYVEGQRIDAAYDAAALDLTARVRSCLQMFEAVAHAHGRLVLHRDIKPTNVMVDRDGQVKLIDFGVARLLETDENSATGPDLTGEFGRAFTPRFGAPEQLAGEPASAATDVYSLGLLMYVLLAGANPRDGRTGPGEALPPASVVARRAGHASRAQQLKGDLDNILAKAVKDDPRERYASVDAFAEDLRRFLRHDPVSARPDTLVYRANRFVARHRVAVAATAVGLAGMAVLTATTFVQAREVARQRTRAVARGAAAYAVAQAPTRIDRALLLGVEASRMHRAAETTVGLHTAIDASRHLVRFHRQLGEVVRLAVSSDRRQVATIDAAGKVRRWSLPTWTLLNERDTGLVDPHTVLFAGGGTRILIGTYGGGRILDASTLERVPGSRDLTSPEPGLEPNPAISPDGTLVVETGYYRGRIARIRDVATWAIKADIHATECGGIGMASFLPGRPEVVLTCMTGLYVYDTDTGALRRSRRSGPSTVTVVDPSGRSLLIAPYDIETVVLDATSLEPVLTIPVPGGRAYMAAFTTDGRGVAIGTDAGNVTIWDIASRREVTRLGGLDESVQSLEWLDDAFSVEKDRTVSGSARLLVQTGDSVTEWDLVRTSGIGVASRPALPPALQFALVHDRERGLYFAAPTDPSRIEIGVVADIGGPMLRTIPIAADAVHPVAVSADGRRLLVSTAHRPTTSAPAASALSVVDTTSGAQVAILAASQELLPPLRTEPDGRPIVTPFVNARFSPDGERVLGWSATRLQSWSTASGQTLASIAVPHPQPVVTWAPDGQTVVSARDGVLSVYEADTLRLVATKEVTKYSIKHMYPSSALRGVVYTSEGGDVAVFDPGRGMVVGQPFRAGGAQLQTSTLSPDGRMLAAIASDGAVRLWDVDSRVPIAPPLRGHAPGRGFPYLWFTDSGLSTYLQGVRFDWNLDMSTVEESICQRVGRTLSELEWRQFVGDVPYQPTCGDAPHP